MITYASLSRTRTRTFFGNTRSRTSSSAASVLAFSTPSSPTTTFELASRCHTLSRANTASASTCSFAKDATRPPQPQSTAPPQNAPSRCSYVMETVPLRRNSLETSMSKRFWSLPPSSNASAKSSRAYLLCLSTPVEKLPPGNTTAPVARAASALLASSVATMSSSVASAAGSNTGACTVVISGTTASASHPTVGRILEILM
mmetsp:Transcript_14966/g.40132  ORF Transcript_14966/g.40132 Transcript_14966/m.40132 type:complete len:202 (-) Transcript_14966:624-1229(-)